MIDSKNRNKAKETVDLQWKLSEFGRLFLRCLSVAPVVITMLAFPFVATAQKAGEKSEAVSASGLPSDLKAKLALVKKLEKQRIAAINKVKPAVVAVFGLDKKGGGSGVIIHPSGLALTNHHVVQGAGTRGVGGLDDGKQYPWELIGNDPGGDLALIKLKRKEPFPFVELGDSDKVKVGDWTLVMGNPFLLAEDFNPTVTFGIVSGVKRYQKGMTDRLLVYGNCIQVDSSINPGNSGGPLFDIQGRLIGINGRASFDFAKRGRVNVGIGYAISINQCRNFLPDLMATKLVQHGGLDAVFEDRDGKVVCAEIFEDAEIATLGMDIGDELVEFEGEVIRSANQFTNLLCTLPAGWPAKVTFKSQNGLTHKVITRLVGLPYPKASPPPPRKKPKKPAPKKGKPPGGKKNGKPEGKKDGKQKKQSIPKLTKKPNKKLQTIQKSKADFFKFMSAKGGVIQNEYESNRNGAIVSGFAPVVFTPKADQGWRLESEISEGGKIAGTQTLLIWPSGDFELRISLEQKKVRWKRTEGKVFHGEVTEDQFQDWESVKLNRTDFEKALNEPAFLSASMLIGDQEKWRFLLAAHGSDSLDLTPCCRLRLRTTGKKQYFAWYSFFDFKNPSTCRLMKTAVDIDGDEGAGGVRYHEWEETEFGVWPKKRVVVTGLGELEIQRWTTKKISKWSPENNQK